MGFINFVYLLLVYLFFFFSSRRRHTRSYGDWSSDVCSSDLVILAEVGDFSRFANARKLAAWAGLTPTVRGSDQVVRHGHISKQGSAWLRWILCEPAQTAKRSAEFSATYQAITRRRGKKIATIAVARKLLS